MEASTPTNVFYINPQFKKAKIVAEDGFFYIYSHIEKKSDGTVIKPIRLPTLAMKTLLTQLPICKKRVEQLEYELGNLLQQEADFNSMGIQPNILLPPDKEYLSFCIFKDKNFDTKLSVSTYKNNVYLWLKLYFTAKDRTCPGTIKTFACHGGSLLNEVNVEDLEKFVQTHSTHQTLIEVVL